MKDTIALNGRELSVERLLGKGKGGYSYLVCDGEALRVLKQIHHEPCAYYRFGDKLAAELHDYERLKAIGVPMPELLEVDTAAERILKEYVPGETIFELVRSGNMREIYLQQIQALCGRLYAANTNIDYFPTNFVVRDDMLFYVDYECNDYMQQWDFEHWGIQYWSMTDAFRQYLAEHDG